MAPFATLGKKTCGYGFNYETDNRKKDFGIPPADLPRWRSDTTTADFRTPRAAVNGNISAKNQ
jgi:hypothetical protein